MLTPTPDPARWFQNLDPGGECIRYSHPHEAVMYGLSEPGGNSCSTGRNRPQAGITPPRSALGRSSRAHSYSSSETEGFWLFVRDSGSPLESQSRTRNTFDLPRITNSAAGPLRAARESSHAKPNPGIFKSSFLLPQNTDSGVFLHHTQQRCH